MLNRKPTVISKFRKITEILVAKWGDELVIFHDKCGDTHLLPAIYEPIIRYCLKHDDFLSSDLLLDINAGVNKIISEDEAECMVNDCLEQLIRMDFLQSSGSEY